MFFFKFNMIDVLFIESKIKFIIFCIFSMFNVYRKIKYNEDREDKNCR